jgi:hypothetical protein
VRLLGVEEPFSILAAFFSMSEAGGLFVMKETTCLRKP